MRRWIIVDMDGTLADCSSRVPLIPDWDAFHAGCKDDPPFLEIVELVGRLADFYNICILTGRPVTSYAETERWLEDFGIVPDAVLMRPVGDFRPDTEYKWAVASDFFGVHIKTRVLFVLDDRDKVVQMWRDNGLTCLQPRLGDY